MPDEPLAFRAWAIEHAPSAKQGINARETKLDET